MSRSAYPGSPVPRVPYWYRLFPAVIWLVLVLCALAGGLFALAYATYPAHADDGLVPVAVSFLSAILAPVLGIAAPIVAVFACSALAQVAKRAGLDITLGQRQIMNEAMSNGINAGIQNMAKYTNGGPVGLEHRETVKLTALNYVMNTIPDTLHALGASKSGNLMNLIEARLPPELAKPVYPATADPRSISDPVGSMQGELLSAGRGLSSVRQGGDGGRDSGRYSGQAYQGPPLSSGGAVKGLAGDPLELPGRALRPDSLTGGEGTPIIP